jgi:hypothetical protein
MGVRFLLSLGLPAHAGQDLGPVSQQVVVSLPSVHDLGLSSGRRQRRLDEFGSHFRNPLD